MPSEDVQDSAGKTHRHLLDLSLDLLTVACSNARPLHSRAEAGKAILPRTFDDMEPDTPFSTGAAVIIAVTDTQDPPHSDHVHKTSKAPRQNATLEGFPLSATVLHPMFRKELIAVMSLHEVLQLLWTDELHVLNPASFLATRPSSPRANTWFRIVLLYILLPPLARHIVTSPESFPEWRQRAVIDSVGHHLFPTPIGYKALDKLLKSCSEIRQNFDNNVCNFQVRARLPGTRSGAMQPTMPV